MKSFTNPFEQMSNGFIIAVLIIYTAIGVTGIGTIVYLAYKLITGLFTAG